MDNMASAETNENSVLEQLFTNITTQYAVIKALLQEFKPHRWSNNFVRNPSTNQTPDGNDMRKLKKRNATLQHTIVKGLG